MYLAKAKIGLINIILRFSGSVIKYFFIVILTKFSNINITGKFILIFSCVEISRIFLNLDFHNYFMREVVVKINCLKKTIINTSLFLLNTNIIVLPIILFVIHSYIIKIPLLILCFIMIFNNLNFMIEKLFISLSKPTISYFSGFLRLGFWQFLVTLFLVLNLSNSQEITINCILKIL